MWGINSNLNQSYVNNYLGSRIQSMKQALDDIYSVYNTWYLANGAAGLSGVGTGQLGYSITDTNQIASFLTDWATKLYPIYYGNGFVDRFGNVTLFPGSGYNFDINAKQGGGLSVHP